MDLYKDEAKYAKCDYYNHEHIEDATHGIEIKGRVDIAHDLYSTGFVDVHKVDAHLIGKKYHYVFIYKDGIFYTPYNKKRFNTYTINREYTEYRPEVGWEKSPKYEVPYTDMKPICLFNK
jgi:hypothetical protein